VLTSPSAHASVSTLGTESKRFWTGLGGMAPRRGERQTKRSAAASSRAQTEHVDDEGNLAVSDAYWGLGGDDSAVNSDNFPDHVAETFGTRDGSPGDSSLGEGIGRRTRQRLAESEPRPPPSPLGRSTDTSHYLFAVVDFARYDPDTPTSTTATAASTALGVRRDAGRAFSAGSATRADGNPATAANAMLSDLPNKQSPERQIFEGWLEGTGSAECGVVSAASVSPMEPPTLPPISASRAFAQDLAVKIGVLPALRPARDVLIPAERLPNPIESGTEDIPENVHLQTDDELAQAKLFAPLRDPESERGTGIGTGTGAGTGATGGGMLLLSERDRTSFRGYLSGARPTGQDGEHSTLALQSQALNWDQDDIPPYVAHDGAGQLGPSTGTTPLERHIRCPKCSDPGLNKPVCPACRQRHHRMMKHASDGRCQWGDACRLCTRRQRQRARQRSSLPSPWETPALGGDAASRQANLDAGARNAAFQAAAGVLTEQGLSDHGLLLTTARRTRRSQPHADRSTSEADPEAVVVDSPSSGALDRRSASQSLRSRASADALELHRTCQACCATQVCGNCRKRHSRMMQRQGTCDWGNHCRLCARKRRRQHQLQQQQQLQQQSTMNHRSQASTLAMQFNDQLADAVSGDARRAPSEHAMTTHRRHMASEMSSTNSNNSTNNHHHIRSSLSPSLSGRVAGIAESTSPSDHATMEAVADAASSVLLTDTELLDAHELRRSSSSSSSSPSPSPLPPPSPPPPPSSSFSADLARQLFSTSASRMR